MKKIAPIFLLLVLFQAVLGPTMLTAQKYKPGPQDLVFFSKVDETNQPYSIYIPKNYDENKKYPLVIFLHGIMSNNRLGLMRLFGVGNTQGPDFQTPGFVPPVTDLEATRQFSEFKDADFFAAAPYARGTAGYQGIPEEDFYQMIDDIKDRFNIDEDRLYLTGLSAGGGGTLWLGLTRPDMWAAIAPLCPAKPENMTNLAGNALNIPVHMFVGDRDPIYPTAKEAYEILKANNINLEYKVYPGIAHNCWEYAYKDNFIFDWFSQFTRNLYPNQVKYESKQFKYTKAYWVKLDNFTSGTWASIKAEFKGTNNIEATTTGLDAFTFNLKGHPMFKPNEKLNVKLDGTLLTVKSPDAVSFIKENGVWKNKKFTPGLYSKKAGAEGPMLEALNTNHVYVYGTADNPSKEELNKRMEIATYAADWAAYRPVVGRMWIFPRVLADTEVRQSDIEHSNLVLFGTAETNSIIKQYADKLPMHLSNDAANTHGLVYIFPLNGHYVLVNSGLPWWTPKAKRTPQGGFGGATMSLSKAASVLPDKDFILFKDTPDNIITHNSFDNNWDYPAEDLNKLKSSGVVKITPLKR